MFYKRTSVVEAYQADQTGHFAHPDTGEKMFCKKGDYIAFVDVVADWMVVPKDVFERTHAFVPDEIYEIHQEAEDLKSNTEDWSNMRNKRFSEYVVELQNDNLDDYKIAINDSIVKRPPLIRIK